MPSQTYPQIFANRTFWVAQRVPNRPHLLDDIKRHGGKITRVERLADVLVADASRNDSPRGAHSHKLILNSILHKSFQLLDSYKLDKSVRPAGSERPAKVLRQGFTYEEDCKLAKFVREQLSRQSSNTLYVEFAERWPSHTWQSWRSRWLTKLRQLPSDNLDAMVRQATEDETRQRSSPSPAREQPTEPEAHQPTPDEKQAPEADNNPIADENQDEQSEENEEMDDEELAERAQNHFYRELSDYVTENGLQAQIYPVQDVNGSSFGLWDMFMGYAAQDVEPENVELGQLASYLDFDGTDPDVVEQLRVIWKQNLMVFAQYRARLGDDEEGEENEEDEANVEAEGAQGANPEANEVNEAVEATAPNEGQEAEVKEESDDEAPLPILESHEEVSRPQPHSLVSPTLLAPPMQRSSPPVPPHAPPETGSSQAGPSQPSTRKRTQYQSQALSSRKRRRLDPNAEIPSTPDHVLGVIRPSIEEGNDEAEEGEQPQSQKLSSSVQRRLFGHVEVKDSQEDSQAAFTQAQNKTPKRRTQKAKEPIVLQTQTTVVDVSPSQQLQSELVSSASKRAISSRRGEKRNSSRRDSSPTPKEVVPRTQVSTQTRTPNPSKSPSKTKSLSNSRALPKVDIPPPIVPPKRSLPSTFARDKQPQTKAPPRNPIQKAPTPLSASDRRSETAASSHQRQPLDDYDPDSQDPLNEPPARPRLTSGLSTLDDWINHYQGLGYPRKMVIVALKATTMTPGGQAAQTMESLKKGQGIPSNYEGVWTERDDRGLSAVKNLEKELGEEIYVAKGAKFNVKGKGTLDRTGKVRKEKARLLDKHGPERMKLRLQFLEAERGDDGVA